MLADVVMPGGGDRGGHCVIDKPTVHYIYDENAMLLDLLGHLSWSNLNNYLVRAYTNIDNSLRQIIHHVLTHLNST